MRALLLVPLFFVACLDVSSAPPPTPLCEAEVCEYVSECSRLTTAGWDWRSEGACMDTFTCGEMPEACWEAVMALPCLAKNPRQDEIENHTRAMLVVRKYCR